jgi:ferredoxin-NADP reductase
MLWMYFRKMRRASLLLLALTGGAPPPAPTVVTNVSARPVRSDPTVVPAAARVGSTKWSGQLRVGRIFQETPDVKTLRLMNPLGGGLPFSYLPGQFLTVAVPADGMPMKRSYTIASSPTQHDYAEITVKHEEGGVVSSFLHARVMEGDLVECSGPGGTFIFTGRECTCILLIGAGVGITPLMSVLRYLLDRSWSGDIYLVYGCHTPQDIIFREELDYLQRRHPHLHVVITVSRPEGTDWQGPQGRITQELLAASVPDLPSRYVHICGPVPMMEAVKQMLADLSVPQERIKTEAFGPALGKVERTMLEAVASADRGTQGGAAAVALPTVTFSLSDKSALLPPHTVILEVAEEIGIDIDYSCRVGTCGVCRIKLISGRVTMAIEEGLQPGDKEKGMILACQAQAEGNVTVEA